jgi:hypothetical protein
MNENRVVPFRQEDEIDDLLTGILRTGARRLIIIHPVRTALFLGRDLGSMWP